MTPILMFVLPLVAVSPSAPPKATPDRAFAVDMPKLGKGWYAGNAAPLTPSPFLKLPIGAIKPGGWLKKQLELEADGFVGHLDEVSGFLKKDGNAWLSPTGEGKNGWEELPYWLKGFGDLGYVLGDKRIIAEAKVWLDGAMASQRPDGYFGPQSNLTNAAGKTDLWPNMPMLNAFQSYYEYTGDERVIEFLKRYFKYEAGIPEKDFLTAGGAGFWQNQRGGDNLQSVYWLYNRIKEPWLLELAAKIHRCTADWSKGVANWHGVNFAQSFREPGTYFQQAKKAELLTASGADLAQMRAAYGQVPGGMYGADENARPGYTDPRQATETCSFVEIMWSDELLFAISGDPAWADRCEDVAYNSLPASMTPDLKALRYLTAPNMIQSDAGNKSPGLQNSGPMLLFNPYDHRCCQHNVAQGWPYFAEHLWMATPDKGLAAIFYCASEVKAKVGTGRTVTVTSDTRYPFDESVVMTVKSGAPVAFPLYLRIPRWCSSPKVKLNGKPLKIVGESLGFAVVQRTWKNGDKLELSLPMPISITTWAHNENAVSVNRGPLTYSVKIAERYVRKGGTEKWPAWEVYPETPWNYGLVLKALKPQAIEVVRKPWPADSNPFKWDASPIELMVKAKKIAGWGKDYLGLVRALEQSPVKSAEPVETISLIPMGCGRLRIASIPTITDDPKAKEWPKALDPLPASASWANNSDPISALSDGLVPRSSADLKLPRFTWWDHRGTAEWVQYDLEKPRDLSGVEVYWFDDSGVGQCRAPAAWKLLYLDAGQWKEVGKPTPYGVAKDSFNAVSFDRVRTDKIRIEVQLQPGFSGGILEWRLR